MFCDSLLFSIPFGTRWLFPSLALIIIILFLPIIWSLSLSSSLSHSLFLSHSVTLHLPLISISDSFSPLPYLSLPLPDHDDQKIGRKDPCQIFKSSPPYSGQWLKSLGQEELINEGSFSNSSEVEVREEGESEKLIEVDKREREKGGWTPPASSSSLLLTFFSCPSQNFCKSQNFHEDWNWEGRISS